MHQIYMNLFSLTCKNVGCYMKEFTLYYFILFENFANIFICLCAIIFSRYFIIEKQQRNYNIRTGAFQ